MAGKHEAMNDLEIRRAVIDDLPAIIALLHDDMLGTGREDPSSPPNPRYVAAFEAISSDPNQAQLVAVLAGTVVGTLQLSFIPGLARLGSWRGQIEGVRVSSRHRSLGIGESLFDHAIETCREKGCDLVQLTTDRERPDAHRFYDRLGFLPSHIGYKLVLNDTRSQA